MLAPADWTTYPFNYLGSGSCDGAKQLTVGEQFDELSRGGRQVNARRVRVTDLLG